MFSLNAEQDERPPRLLVAIASYGEKNLEFLRQIIQTYQSMTFEVDVVVLSDAPKNLGDSVKVVVGLPAKNPWSLPFAHKPIFAANVKRYDLFVYTEDDIGVTENQIRAFVRASVATEPDEIPGYLRYEVDQNNMKLLTDVHGSFHWKPESAKRRGSYTIAEFSNDHAGFYVVNQQQLSRAISSGEYLREPYEGRYGLPETAATDIYTCCGFRKVICVSNFDDFFIRHMSNLYVQRHGVSLPVFQEQIQTLMNIRNGTHPASTLCEVESKVLHGRWSKSYDEKPCDELLAMVPEGVQTLLSVGCGSGAVEAKLIQRGIAVTALPLDSVIGAFAARRGIEVIYGRFLEGMNQLAGRKFDCVLVTNLLHLQPKPERFLEECALRVGKDGTLLVTGPNFSRLPTLFKRAFGVEDYSKLRNFDNSGISVCGPTTLARHVSTAGLRITSVQWLNHKIGWAGLSGCRVRFGRFTANNWIFQARRDV